MVPVILIPSVETMLWWLLLLLAAAGADLALAASPRRVELSRSLPDSVRLGESVNCTLTIRNTSGRTLRALVREGWQPSAGAVNPRQQISVPAQERARLTIRLRPKRRGDLRMPALHRPRPSARWAWPRGSDHHR